MSGIAKKRQAGVIEFDNIPDASQHHSYAETGMKIVKDYLHKCAGLIKEKIVPHISISTFTLLLTKVVGVVNSMLLLEAGPDLGWCQAAFI